jgi:hypothetical protein
MQNSLRHRQCQVSVMAFATYPAPGFFGFASIINRR